MTQNRRLRLFLMMAAVLATLLTACGDDRDVLDVGGEPDGSGVALPEGEATYSGEITNVSAFEPITEDCVDPEGIGPDGSVSSDDPPICTDPTKAPLGFVLVEEVPGEQTGDKISLRIEAGTPLLREVSGGDPEAIVFDDLAEGDIVEIWIDQVATSYPLQGTPDALLVRS